MKKTLALVLSIVMAVSLIPFNAFGFDGVIADIELQRAEPIEVYYEVDGYWDTDENNENYFRYNGFIGRGDGDVFTIIDDKGERYEYTASYNEEEREFYLYGEDDDVIPYNDIEMIDEQNQPDKHFTLGDDNYFYIEYRGIRKAVPVSVIKNPVDKIEFVPVSPVQIVENTGGHWDKNNLDEDFYYYEIPDFKYGDVLKVTYAGDENPTIYTYTFLEDEHGFFDEYGEALPEEGELRRSRDSYAIWTVEDGGSYEILYSGRTADVNVEIVENTVTGIDYQRNGSDEYVEGDTRYDQWDDAYYYEHPNFREGDVLTVFEDEKSTNYICKRDEDSWEYFFESEDGSKTIECSWDSGIRMEDSQNETAWEIGNNNEFYVEYMGQRKTLYATVKENPIASISYKRATPDKYIFEVDGYDNDGVFEYWLRMADDGDVLSVTDKKGKTTDYTCTFNSETFSREFVSEDGDIIDEDEVDFYSDQRNNPWTMGDKNEITVSYSGCKCTIYAIVEADPIQSIEYQRTEPAVIFEGTNGWEYDGTWIYDEPEILAGDTLTVHYTNGETKVFTFGYSEEREYSVFIADDGEILEEVFPMSEQWENPWSVGSDNEYNVYYNGKKSNAIKVTIKKNTVTGIDFVPKNPIVIFEENKKEIYYPPADETFEGYEIPFFSEGDKLIVHDSESGDKEYIFTFNEADGERYFMCGDEMLERDEINVYDDQFINPWTAYTENFFTVEYLGKSCNVPVSIVQSDVESIEYTVADPSRLVLLEENENNGRWQNLDGDKFFFYDFDRGYVGDTLKINYKNGTSSVYTVKFDGSPGGVGVYLENEDGDKLAQSEVDIYDNQWDEPWSVGDDNVYYVKYKGVVCEINVEIKHDFAKKVVKPTCSKQGYTVYTCKACGEEYQDDFTSATGKHTSDKGTVTKKATYTATGTRTYKCTECKKILKTETIPKLKKKTNPLKVSGKTVTIKYNKLKKKNQTVTKAKAFTVSGAKGKVTFTKSSGNKKITVNKTTGKITVKKGLKKGTYKVKIKVKAAGTTEYKSKTKTVTVTIKVK